MFKKIVTCIKLVNLRVSKPNDESYLDMLPGAGPGLAFLFEVVVVLLPASLSCCFIFFLRVDPVVATPLLREDGDGPSVFDVIPVPLDGLYVDFVFVAVAIMILCAF